MTLTAGALSQVSVASTTATLLSAAATSGTAPYTYQWYMSTTSGFTPGSGNLVSGATALSQAFSGLIPNTTYYFKVVVTDSAAATATATQLTVVTAVPTLNQNQFTQSTLLGQIDMRFPYNTVSVQIDSSQATPLYAGSAVKAVDSADGVPKVVGCTADSDECIGFINFDLKTLAFTAGAAAEISQDGNYMYLYATGAISRFAQVTLDITTNGGVGQLVGSSGAKIVGYAYDKATAGGTLIRVRLKCPSYTVA